MKIGSGDNSIYKLLTPAPSKTIADSNSSARRPLNRPMVYAPSSDQQAASELTARLALSSFNRHDTNKDGVVEKNEYVKYEQEIAKERGRDNQLSDIERTWNEIDKNGKGSLSQSDYTEGHSSILVASVGHITKPLR